MWRLSILLIMVILAISACALWLRVGAVALWNEYSSSKTPIHFEYPENWEVLHDEEINRDTVLCPPEGEQITARYHYMNCITFLFGDRVRNPMNEMEGDNAVFSEFSADITSNANQQYRDYRRMRYNPEISDPAINLVGLYRNGSNMIGLWQPLCALGKRSECIRLFQHVLGSVEEFN